MINHLNVRSLLFGTGLLLLAAACAPDDSVGETQAPLASDGTYSDRTPVANQTRIVPGSTMGLTHDAVVDASGGRTWFPMPRNERVFTTWANLMGFVASAFFTSVVVDGSANGVHYTQAAIDTSFFAEMPSGQIFVVGDPLLAYVGGIHGLVKIGSTDVCIDPDHTCSGTTYASYMIPQGQQMKPTEHNVCNGGGTFCYHSTSFFNSTFFAFTYARHGTNIAVHSSGGASAGEVLTWAGFYPVTCPTGSTPYCVVGLGYDACWCETMARATDLKADGFYAVPGAVPPAGYSFFYMPEGHVSGEDSVETSGVCFFFGLNSDPRDPLVQIDCPEYAATAVCGTTHGDDARLASVTDLTGNGGDNNTVCGL